MDRLSDAVLVQRKEVTFLVRIDLQAGDARPSDALALGLRMQVPIGASEGVQATSRHFV